MIQEGVTNIRVITADKYQTVTGYPVIPAGTTIEYLGNLGDKARMQIVSYVGTGTYGENNPCSITADFPIKFALMIGYSQYQSNIMLTPGTMPTTFAGEPGFYINNDYSRSYGKTSVDKKTITWYLGSKTSQLNATNQTYQVLCVR